jgi:ADP-ribose pyrophosphatase
MADLSVNDAGLIETRMEGETLYRGNFLSVKRDIVRLPDGKTATREYVEHPGAVMVLPLFDDGRVLMERQYRYPIGDVMIEYPAGKLDPNESTLACAQRELREETGYTAHEFIYMTRIHPVISYSTEFIDIYLARGLHEGEASLDDGEFLETFIVEPKQVLEWIRTGKISDVKTIIGTLWLQKFLSGEWEMAPAEKI